MTLDTRRQQLIGVRTVAVRRMVMSPEIRAAATVAYDETRQSEINTRVDGWIRDLHADFTGREIHVGEGLFTLYSPDLVATQNEYLLALRGASHSDHGDPGNLRDYADRLVQAARERLLRLDMKAEEIDELQKRGQAADTVTFRSPVSGVIVEKAAVRGMRVMAGQMLFRVADLSTVWVEAEVYESDAAAVRTGARAVVTVPAYPGRSFTGRIGYVYPTVSAQTRTLRVRIALANPAGLLKPNMLATVTLQTPRSAALVLPDDAVVDTGAKQVVFLAQGDGRFTPRDVQTGRRTGGDVEVSSGLNEGEQVAASATFFLDSESQLRGALQNYQAPEPAPQPAARAGAQSLEVGFRTDPDTPKAGEASLIVSVKDGGGQPVTGADVSVVLFMAAMPTMNMPAIRTEAKLSPAGAGAYRGIGQVMMPGRWDVTVTIARAGQELVTRQCSMVAR